MFLWKRYIKNILMAFGVVLWVGALSPEIFIQSGLSCILDENGEELTAEDAEKFMEAYFYGNANENSGQDATVEIQYKFALLEWLR
ncbi:MAG: hypothetical protein K2G51_15995 [Lachnospiraceae bacterium]|nr:hypothetical protein [Lachnospiraceae bacterium]MDE7271562.1 hypothetical protein [Lachnospiraceae bacterium]